MKNTVTMLRERLFSIIRMIGENPERYARKPGRDFTRKRTLTPDVLIYLVLTMDEKSVWKGLLRHFRKRIDTPSASAFVQQRQKLLPSALEDLFHRFSDHLRPQKKFRGYRLLAADGSSLKSGDTLRIRTPIGPERNVNTAGICSISTHFLTWKTAFIPT